MRHLEGARDQVLVLLACCERSNGRGAFTDQRGKLFNKKDADGWGATGMHASKSFRETGNRHVHP